MVQKEIMKYISDNSTKIMNEIGILNKIKLIKGNIIIFVCAVLFLVGAYITYTTPSKPVLPEGFINVEPDAQAAHKLRTVAAAATAHHHYITLDDNNAHSPAAPARLPLLPPSSCCKCGKATTP